jgi:tetratricopeptide (TPR) repeat protein
LLERAAALLLPGALERLALLPELALATLEAGRFDDVVPYVAELAEAPDERARAYSLLLRAAHATSTGAGSSGERAAAIAAREAFERLGDGAGLARALERLALAEWSRCRAAAVAEISAEALPLARRAQNHQLVNDIEGGVLLARTFGPTPVHVAERAVREVLADAGGAVRLEAVAQIALGRLAAMRGSFAEARRWARAGRDALREAGLRIVAAATSQADGEIEKLAGDDEAALAALQRGFAELAELGEHAFASTNAAAIAAILERLDRVAEAAEWLERARTLSPDDDFATLVTADCVDALLAARAGEHERAVEIAHHASRGPKPPISGSCEGQRSKRSPRSLRQQGDGTTLARRCEARSASTRSKA